jgi:hypothetical protein
MRGSTVTIKATWQAYCPPSRPTRRRTTNFYINSSNTGLAGPRPLVDENRACSAIPETVIAVENCKPHAHCFPAAASRVGKCRIVPPI